MTKVSIIVPVYNVEKYIGKCLDSLVNQTLEDIEIIVVNDGSPDNSQEIIDNYVKKYPNKVKSFIKENGGQGSARNYGMTKAKGKYIGFVDSDDYVDLDMYDRLYSIAETTKSDIVATTQFFIESINSTKIDKFYRVEIDDMFKKFIVNEAGPCNKIIKRSLVIQNNFKFFEGHFYEDIAVMPSLALYAKKIYFLDSCMYHYVYRIGSTMNQKNYNKKIEDIFPSLQNLREIFINHEKYEKYFSELEYIYISHLLHDAFLRFLKYPEGTLIIDKIIKIIENDFPNWKNNIYFKKRNLKYRIVCYLAFKKKIKILKLILK